MDKIRTIAANHTFGQQRAVFANYKDTNAANELYDKIKSIVGGDERCKQ